MRERTRLLALAGAALGGAMLALPAGAGAATITVTTTADDTTNNGSCSLREATIAANGNSNIHEGGCNPGDPEPTPDTIVLGSGTYTLTGASGENAGDSGDLDISAGGPVIFQGAPINSSDRPVTVINGNDVDRLFHLGNDGGGQVDVELLALELRDGKVTGSADGGAVEVEDPDARLYIDTVIATSNQAGDYGGAVHFANGDADARFAIEQSEFSGNSAGDEGGALWLDLPDGANVAEILNSAFVGNSADEMGGAIYLGTRAADGIQLFLTNTTISGNSATLGGGALAFDLAEGANAYFDFSTIAYNTTSTAGAGGGIRTVPPSGNNGQFVLLTHSIIAGNKAAGVPSNCVGPANYSGSGDSIESTNSCGLNTANSLVNTDPQLAPLATSPGGEQTTRTHGLYDSSPALDFFPASLGQCSGIAFDQRYSLRPAGDGCDVGAFEGSVGPAPPKVKCGGRTATRVGTAGRDVLKGTKKADVFAGLGGKDKLVGKSGKDLLCGGDGKDKLLGGKGKDKLFGQAGADVLKGGPGKDKLKGGAGKDKQVQ